jgi:hypothetical protein
MPQIDGNFCDEMLYSALILLFFFDDNDVEDHVLLLSVWLYLYNFLKSEAASYTVDKEFFSKVILLNKS